MNTLLIPQEPILPTDDLLDESVQKDQPTIGSWDTDFSIQDGQVEESFAVDTNGLGPLVKPCRHLSEHVKQDLIHNFMDDIWTDISDTLGPLFEKLSQIRDMSNFGSSTQSESDEISLQESDGEEENYLASAMTIRPIPLQKREASAGIRRDLPETNLPLSLARPMSARSNLSRPFSARPDFHQRAPTALAKPIPIKRFLHNQNQTLKLIPLQLPQSLGMQDVISVTTLHPREFRQQTAKRLPPIKWAPEIERVKKSVNFARVMSPRPNSAVR